jgi:DNA-binding transcriptional MerR regulator
MEELTPADVAREFKVSPATVRRWEEKGILKPTRRLPGSHYRRYSRESVEALKAKQQAEQDERDATSGA